MMDKAMMLNNIITHPSPSPRYASNTILRMTVNVGSPYEDPAVSAGEIAAYLDSLTPIPTSRVLESSSLRVLPERLSKLLPEA
jgi:hypothetical protein